MPDFLVSNVAAMKVFLCLELNRHDELNDILPEQLSLASQGKLSSDELVLILSGWDPGRHPLVPHTPGLYKAVEACNTESVEVLLACMLEAASKRLIRRDQFIELMAGYDPARQPALQKALISDGKISLHKDQHARLIRTYIAFACRAQELSIFEPIDLVSFLHGYPFPVPNLAVALACGDVVRINAFLDSVISAAQSGHISSYHLQKILVALMPRDSCALNMIMENGSHGVIKSYLDHLLDAARKKLIDAGQLEELLWPCKKVPALMKSIFSRSGDATRLFVDAVLMAACGRLIDPNQLHFLLDGTNSDGESILRVATRENSVHCASIILAGVLAAARAGIIDAPRLCRMLEGSDMPPLPYLAAMLDHPLMLGTLLEHMLSAALEGLIDRPSLVGLLLSTFGSREKPSLRKVLDEGAPIAIDIYLQFALVARQKDAIHSGDLMTLFRGLSPDVKKTPLLWRAMANDKKEVVKAWLNHLTAAAKEKLLDSGQLVSLLGFHDSSTPENESSYEIALGYQHLDLARYFKERIVELQKDGYLSEDDVSVILHIGVISTKRSVKEHGSHT